MMTLLAGLVSGLWGPTTRYLTVAVVVFTVAIGGARSLVKRGEEKCELRHAKVARLAAEKAAKVERERAQAILDTERQINGELRHELDKQAARAAELRALPGGDDPRCVSDDFLRRMREGQPRGRGEKRP